MVVIDKIASDYLNGLPREDLIKEKERITNSSNRNNCSNIQFSDYHNENIKYTMPFLRYLELIEKKLNQKL